MAAGLGFKDFTTGEVLTAADVDGYLMQGIWVFASAAARDAAVTSPQEGNFAYLKDTNTTTYYTGSAWTNLDTTGMVNPMTTTGDTIYSSSGSTPARLGIGSTGQVLTVAGGVPSWATPSSGGGMTLLSTTTLSGTSTLITSVNQGYNNLLIIIKNINVSSSTNAYMRIEPNSTTNETAYSNQYSTGSTISTQGDSSFAGMILSPTEAAASNTNNAWALEIYDYASTTNFKPFNLAGSYVNSSSGTVSMNSSGSHRSNTAITEFRVYSGNSISTFNSGTVLIYGVK